MLRPHDGEGAALAERALYADGSSVRGRDLLDERETEPDAAVGPRRALMRLHETIEDVRLQLLRDPDAVVVDLDARLPLVGGHRDPDAPRRRIGELERVG